MNNNSLKFFKKSRPKLNAGDYFYYYINNQYYIAIIIQNKVYDNLKDASGVVNGCFFLNLSYQEINDFEEDHLKKAIMNKSLLLPPININKKGWTNGYFISMGNICLEFASEILNNVRYVRSKYNMYNFIYEEKKDIPYFELVGELGVYALEGLEALVQISLDIEFSTQNPDWFHPYEYYEEIKAEFSNLKLPFWFYKAKERLDNTSH